MCKIELRRSFKALPDSVPNFSASEIYRKTQEYISSFWFFEKWYTRCQLPFLTLTNKTRRLR